MTPECIYVIRDKFRLIFFQIHFLSTYLFTEASFVNSINTRSIHAPGMIFTSSQLLSKIADSTRNRLEVMTLSFAIFLTRNAILDAWTAFFLLYSVRR